MKLQDFLEKHNACKDGADWASATGCTTIEQIWLRDDLSFDWRIWIACRVFDQKTLIKFSCLCVLEIWHILTDQRSRNAVEVAEQYATGKCTAENLAAARDAAWAAERAAASAAACDANAAAWAAWAAASAAARAASAAAGYVASAASGVARDARDAAGDAASAAGDAASAAGDAAIKKQNAILLQLAPTITL